MRTALPAHALCASLAFLALTGPARAQCTSNASSCVSCHETQGLRPVLTSAQPWHVDHGFGDLCASCHGGDPAAAAQAPAHVGLRSPLVDPSASCAGCHADAQARAARYSASERAAPATPPAAAPPSPPTAGATADRVLAALALALAALLYLAIRRARGSSPRRALGAWLREATWTPYAAGALLGVVVAIAEVLCGRPLAASGAFDKLAAYPGALLFPTSQYYGHVMTPGITWQVWLVVGVALGAFASSKLAGQARWRWLPDTQWEPRFGPSRRKRLAIAFVGAALVQLGAGIAGGCTSGLAISGGAVLAPGAFVFMAGMFAGGIPTAWIVYRGRSA
ncbi:MAG: YeeE/YedE family protein [Sandaracinaceae bacterium]|nr:YeeE/YedE family protein [Sandaracinaceae bacterium]